MKKLAIILLSIICTEIIESKNPFKKVGKSINSVGKSATNTISSSATNTVTSVEKVGKDSVKVVEQTTVKTISTLENVTKDIGNALDDLVDLKDYIRSQYPVKQKWTDEQLKVRQSKELCPSELNFLKNRAPIVKKSLKDNFDIETPLNIGFCLSGGGNRAMLVALGFLLEAQSSGLYDASLYTAALSGSTWTVCPFAYLNATQKISLTDFKKNLTSNLSDVMKIVVSKSPAVEFPEFNDYQNKSMQNNLIKRYAYDQFLSSIDIYAAFIGYFTLRSSGDNPLDVTWSSIADKIQDGSIPLPMGSAVAYKSSNHDKTDYYWFEAGPFEVGSDQLNAYVPVQAFGAKFNNGNVHSGYQGHVHEYPISFYEGVFGSAFTFSINEIADRSQNPSISIPEIKTTDPITHTTIRIPAQKVTLPIKECMDNSFISDNIIDNMRFSPATFHNYTYGIDGSPLKQEDKIKLFDGGLDFDVPLPLMMRPARKLDVIFICDSHVDLQSFQSAAIHFKRNGIKFPDVSNLTEKDLTKAMTVLNDPRSKEYNKDIITIVYCPFTKNNGYSTSFDPEQCKKDGFCQMLNFNYTQEQADEVINLTRYNVKSSNAEIKAVLKALESQKIKKIK